MNRNPTAGLRIACTALFLAATTALVAGCGGSVNQGNFDKVTTGMTMDQVEAILGKGKEQASTGMPAMSAGGMTVPGMSAKVYAWQDGNKTISVTFMNDKVASKVAGGL